MNCTGHSMTPALKARPLKIYCGGEECVQELLMFMYHLTPEQAAARVPLFQFWLTAFGAALLIWLDSKGVFDGFWSMARLCPPMIHG